MLVLGMKSTWYTRNKEISIARSKAWRLANLERHNKLRNDWAKRNPEKVLKAASEARWRSKGMIGGTIDDYNHLKEEQKGVCGICSKRGKRELAYDHNHQTGTPRGLLCASCNMGHGWLEKHRNNLEWVEKADKYLELFEGVKDT